MTLRSRIIAIGLMAVGLVLTATGLCMATVLKPEPYVNPQVSLSKNTAPVIITAPGLLPAGGTPVTITVEGKSGTDVFVGIGRSDDVAAWTGDAAHVVINDVESWDTLGTKAVKGEDAAVNPRGSDLWVESNSGKTTATVTLAEKSTLYSAIIATDGEGPAAVTVTVTWPQDTETPLAIPFIIIGVVVLAVGAIMMLSIMRQRDRPQATAGESETGNEPATAEDSAPRSLLSGVRGRKTTEPVDESAAEATTVMDSVERDGLSLPSLSDDSLRPFPSRSSRSTGQGQSGRPLEPERAAFDTELFTTGDRVPFPQVDERHAANTGETPPARPGAHADSARPIPTADGADGARTPQGTGTGSQPTGQTPSAPHRPRTRREQRMMERAIATGEQPPISDDELTGGLPSSPWPSMDSAPPPSRVADRSPAPEQPQLPPVEPPSDFVTGGSSRPGASPVPAANQSENETPRRGGRGKSRMFGRRSKRTQDAEPQAQPPSEPSENVALPPLPQRPQQQESPEPDPGPSSAWRDMWGVPNPSDQQAQERRRREDRQ